MVAASRHYTTTTANINYYIIFFSDYYIVATNNNNDKIIINNPQFSAASTPPPPRTTPMTARCAVAILLNRRSATMKLADFMKEPGKHAQSKRSGVRDRAPMASEVAALSTAGKYTVNGTKKCAIPISVEKRKGHDLTVLSNVSGDIACLAKELKKLLGSNCVVRDFSVIEIQGHHRDRVEKFLIQKKCLKGVQKKTKELITEKFERENNMKKKKKEIKKKKDSKDVVAKLKSKKKIIARPLLELLRLTFVD